MSDEELSTTEQVQESIIELEQTQGDSPPSEQAQQAPDWIKNFEDYKQVFEYAKTQHNVDEISLIKSLLNAQLMYQTNPKAFALMLVQQHVPELLERLKQVQAQQAQNEAKGVEDEDLDEEEKQLRETLQQIQQKLEIYDKYFLNQQAAEYEKQLEELASELPMLRNPQIGMQIAQLTQQLLNSGIATDFKDAVRRAYRAVVNETNAQPTKPLRPVNDISEDVETDENASVLDIVNAVYKQKLGKL